jgi:hypothetical protein
MSGHADDQSGSGNGITTWTPPTYNTEQPPTLLKSRDLFEDVNFPGNFARSAKWFVEIQRKKTVATVD